MSERRTAAEWRKIQSTPTFDANGGWGLLDACIADLEATEKEREDAVALNIYFRDSVGECHLMISRNTSEYQVRKEWESTDLPPRLQKVMRRAEFSESALAALRLRLEELAKGMHGAGFHVAAGWLETALSEGAKGGENAAT